MIDQEKIHSQCLSKDPEERIKAVEQFKSYFSLLSDKEQAWKEIIKLTTDEDDCVRFTAASSLISVCHQVSQVQDKQQVWEDLHGLANNKDMNVRSCIVEVLVSSFSHMPDKQLVWNDLIKLTNDKEGLVRLKAIYMLEFAFPYVPDKQKAWNDLIKLTLDEDSSVSSKSTDTLGFVFSHAPDKQQAWKELIKLATNEDLQVRDRAFYALGLSFSQVPDKQKAWQDLHRLTTDEDELVRFFVPDAICCAFSNIQDKKQAWNDLIKLSCDMCTDVGYNAANALSHVFPNISEKQQAWDELIKLTTGEDENFGLYIYHTLGKISIFNASQAETEEDYKKELEKAIEFFDKEVQVLHLGWELGDPCFDNPSEFCLPFYRSCYTIIFKKQEAKEEVDKYLEEAKEAIRGSKSKELPFEAVNNLANALKEVQNLENLDLEVMKGKLNFYRKYCDRAAELMRDTEETAPFASMAMRKGLPILDRNLRELLEAIQRNAKIACKEAKGAAAEEIACAVSREVQKWEIGSQKEMAFNVENLIFTLESSVPRVPENQYIFNRIQQIREQKDVSRQYGIISTIIPLIPKIYMEQKVETLENDIKEINEKVDSVLISLKSGIKEEIEISVGTEVLGTGVTHKITIPLQEISYSALKEDLEKITGIKIDKLSKMPKRLANKVKGYLLLHDKEDILEKLI